MEELILKYALLNAVEHGGKASSKAVLGKVLAESPGLKKDIKGLMEKIEKIVKKVNTLSLDEQREKLKEFKIPEKKEKERYELPPLPNAKVGKVVTAFPPEPSKFPHLGHAKAAFVNYLYAKKYKGRFILRFEDTNPELSKEEYYEAFLEGLKWLGIEWDVLDYASDHLEKFYEYAERLIKEGKAYVCSCKSSEIRRNRRLMKECKCRKNTTKENLELWEKMFSVLREGEASLRLKISMTHKNAAMRDPTIMRIVEHSHPRTGNRYRVWPTYDFATALMDVWEGVTHRIRSKEFEMRKELQQFIQKCFGFKSPFITEMARFNLEGVPSSGRKIREMIKKGELLDWDDPRLTTLIALKRRGFVPEAIREFLISTGVSKAESVLTWDMLESFNRKVIDPKCNRYFCVLNPVKIRIKGAREIKETKVKLHPDFPERGERRIPVDLDEIYIEREDLEKLRGKIVRLIGLFNVKLNKEANFVGDEIVKEMPKIHWVSKNNVRVRILMPNGEIREGIAEPEVKKLEVDERIQFVRVGFCRLDRKEPELFFYFTHK